MFLHQRTQIALCRLGFVLFCIAPTILVLGWAVWLRQPARVRRLERELGAKNGLDWAIGQVVHPRRGITRINQVQLRDPASGAVLANAAKVEVAKAAGGTRITTKSARINIAARDVFADFVRLKLERAAPLSGDLWLLADELVCEAGKRQWALAHVKSGIELATDSARAYVTFALAGHDDGPQLGVVRRREEKPGAYQVALKTGKSPLPCQMLEALGIDARCLGPEATFVGSAWGSRSQGEWITQISGKISQVDLQWLLGDGSPHRLTGQAEVAIALRTPMRIRGGRLEQLRATIAAGPGEISPSLLAGAFRYLEMPKSAELGGANDPQLKPYQQLAFDLNIDSQGISILGRCDQGGAVLCDEQGALLTQPRRTQSVARLIEMLSPATKTVIPISQEAQRLAQRLPIDQTSESPDSKKMGVRVQPNSVLR